MMRVDVSALRSALLLLTVAGFAGTAGAAPPRCDTPAERAALALTSTAVQVECDCANAASHNAYVQCTRDAIAARVASGDLPKDCVREARACSRKSTCGRAEGWVTCCRTDRKGRTRCSAKKNASKCKAPRPGSACVSTASACCDACTDGGCADATIRCCVGLSPAGALLNGANGALQCQELTPSECTAAGGTNIGAGTCDPNACDQGPTTTTTSVPTTTTTTSPGSPNGALIDLAAGVPGVDRDETPGSSS